MAVDPGALYPIPHPPIWESDSKDPVAFELFLEIGYLNLLHDHVERDEELYGFDFNYTTEFAKRKQSAHKNNYYARKMRSLYWERKNFIAKNECCLPKLLAKKDALVEAAQSVERLYLYLSERISLMQHAECSKIETCCLSPIPCPTEIKRPLPPEIGNLLLSLNVAKSIKGVVKKGVIDPGNMEQPPGMCRKSYVSKIRKARQKLYAKALNDANIRLRRTIATLSHLLEPAEKVLEKLELECLNQMKGGWYTPQGVDWNGTQDDSCARVAHGSR